LEELFDLDIKCGDLEELFDQEIPCDGVIALDIPPHDAPARWTKAGGHKCTVKNRSNKCEKCYESFTGFINSIIASYGAVGCSYCNKVFYDLDSFGVYRRL